MSQTKLPVLGIHTPPRGYRQFCEEEEDFSSPIREDASTPIRSGSNPRYHSPPTTPVDDEDADSTDNVGSPNSVAGLSYADDGGSSPLRPVNLSSQRFEKTPPRNKSAEVARLRRLVSVNSKLRSPHPSSVYTDTAGQSTAPHYMSLGHSAFAPPPSVRAAAVEKRSILASSKRMMGSRGQALMKKRYGSLSGADVSGVVNRDSATDSAKTSKSVGKGSGSTKGKSISKSVRQEKVESRDDSPKKATSKSTTITSSRTSLPATRPTPQPYIPPKRTKSILFQKMFMKSSPNFTMGSNSPTWKKKYPTISELCRAVLPIQTMARSWLARRAVVKRARDILLVQCVLRQWMARTEYMQIRSKVISIQSLQRGNVARDHYEQLCSRMLIAVRTQSWFRGARVRSELAREHLAATTIQKRTRATLATKQYHCVLRGITSFQAVARMFPLRTAFVRHRIVRRALLLATSATVIQSAIRGCLQRMAYAQMSKELRSAVAIQSQWRSYCCVCEYTLTICDVVAVQSVARRWLAVLAAKEKREERDAAVAIQSLVRGRCARLGYASTLRRIGICQSVVRKWRAVRAVEQRRVEKQQKEEYEAATEIESAWRGFAARREYVMTVGDLILCQSIVRRFLASRRVARFQNCVAAATLIQAMSRTWAATQDFLYTISCIVIVQSIFRRLMACRQLKQLKAEKKMMDEYLASVAAAVKIATCWRRFYCQSEYRNDVQDVIICQSVARRNMATAQATSLRQAKCNLAAIKIQSTWRSYIAMDQYMRTVLDIVVVQSLSRRWASSRLVDQMKKEKHLMEVAAAIKIATCWRRLVCVREYKQTVRDVTICQSVIRRNKAAAQAANLRQIKRTAAATKIQATWKGFTTMDRYLHTILDIVLVQTLARRLIASRLFDQMKEQRRLVEATSAILIVSHWRRFVCSCIYRQTIKDITICQSVARRNIATAHAASLRQTKRNVAATRIQAAWRGCVSMDQYLHEIFDIVLVQSIARRWTSSRLVSLMKAEKCRLEAASATRIASHWRGFISARNYKRTVQDVTLCQAAARRNLAAARAASLREKKREFAAIKIQAAWRGCVAMEHEMQSEKRMASATIIQARWRASSAMNVYIATLLDIVQVQSIARKLLAQKSLRQLKEAKNIREAAAATTISSAWRSHSCVIEFKKTVAGIVTVQSIYRRNIAMREAGKVVFTVHEEACASYIQEIWKAYKHREKFIRVASNMHVHQQKEAKSATEISKTWRGYTTRRKYLSMVKDVTLCQTVFRRNLAAKEVAILRWVSKTAATVIQTKWRSWTLCRDFGQLVAGVVALQCCARRSRASKRFLLIKLQKRLKEVCFLEVAAVTRIATMWRRFSCQQQYLLKMEALKHAEQERFEQQVACSTNIQSLWRGKIAKAKYAHTVSTTIILQSFARRLAAKNQCRQLVQEKWQVESECASKIQAACRSSHAKAKYAHTVSAIIVLQSFARRLAAENQCRQLMREKRQVESECATKIQAACRSSHAKAMYAHTVSTIIVLQSFARRLAAQNQLWQLIEERRIVEVAAAIKISSSWRGLVCSRNYGSILKDIVICQSVARRQACLKTVEALRCHRRVKTNFTRTVSAVIVIQSIARMLAAQCQSRQLKEEKFLVESAAATKISSSLRGFVCSKNYAHTLKDIVACQAAVRRTIASKRAAVIRHEKHKDCAHIIQKKWRYHAGKRLVLRIVSKMEPLQQVERKSATMISKSWRGFKCHREYKQTASVCQAVTRQWLASRKVEALRHEQFIVSAVLIQANWRGLVAARQFVTTRSDVIYLQSLVRRRISTKLLNELKMEKEIVATASTKITSSWKRHFCQIEFRWIIEDVVVCQSIARRNSAASKLESLRQDRRVASATCIQAQWRGHLTMKSSVSLMASVIVLQANVRRWLAVNRLRREERAATKIQSSWLAFYWRREYVLTILDVIMCQSIARRYILVRNRRQACNDICAPFVRRGPRTFSATLLPPNSALYETILRQKIAIHRYRRSSNQQGKLQVITGQSTSPPLIPTLSPPRPSQRQSILRKMVATKKIEQLLRSHLRKQEVASNKIKSAYRQHLYRTKRHSTLRNITKCQSAFRRWRAIRRAEELRSVKKQGPEDIFKFIRSRQVATAKIQTSYQEYTSRNFELAYQEYLIRLNHAANNEPYTKYPIPCAIDETTDTHEVNNPAVQGIEAHEACLDTSIHDLLFEESVDDTIDKSAAVPFIEDEPVIFDSEEESVAEKEESAAVSDASQDGPVILDSEEANTSRAASSDALNDNEDMNMESQCFDHSRCGLADGIHEMLIESGKWFYDKLGDPSEATAEDLVTVMEISEELCCLKRKPTARGTAKSVAKVTTEDEPDAELSAVAIQSRWRTYLASKHCARIRNKNALDPFRSMQDTNSFDDSTCAESDISAQPDITVKKIVLCQSVVRRMLVVRNASKWLEPRIASAEPAIVKCQSAVRKLLASRRVQKLLLARQASFTSKTVSTGRKHVAKTGQIELILNESEEDASLTDYSESESSDGTLSALGEGLAKDCLAGSDLKGEADASMCEVSRTGDEVSSPKGNPSNAAAERRTVINSSGLEVVINGVEDDEASLTDSEAESSVCKMPQIQEDPNEDQSLSSEAAPVDKKNNETVEEVATLPMLVTIPTPGVWKMDLWSTTW